MLKNLKDIRTNSGLTQEALAKRLGIARTSITKWENGELNVSLRWIEKLAKALNCSTADLFEEAEGGWVKPADDNLIWQIMEPIIEQARAYQNLDKKLLVAIAQAVYRSAKNGHLPTAKGKAGAKNLAKALHVETTRLVEYEASKRDHA